MCVCVCVDVQVFLNAHVCVHVNVLNCQVYLFAC